MRPTVTRCVGEMSLGGAQLTVSANLIDEAEGPALKHFKSSGGGSETSSECGSVKGASYGRKRTS